MTDSESDGAHGESGPGGGEPAVDGAGHEHEQGHGHGPRGAEQGDPQQAGIRLWNFRLGFGRFAPRRPNDANYSAYMRLKTAPPLGCTFREDYGFARLECRWPGPDRLAAVGQLVRQIRSVYGLVGTDELGIERLGEWAPTDREWAECTVGQLLLMGSGRAEQLGYGVEDVVAFVRDAMVPVPAQRQAAGRSRSVGVELDCPGPDDPEPDDDEPDDAEPDDNAELDDTEPDDTEPEFEPASGTDPIG